MDVLYKMQEWYSPDESHPCIKPEEFYQPNNRIEYLACIFWLKSNYLLNATIN